MIALVSRIPFSPPDLISSWGCDGVESSEISLDGKI